MRATISLRTASRGLSYKEIADRHHLSISTIEKHVAKALLQITGWLEGW